MNKGDALSINNRTYTLRSIEDFNGWQRYNVTDKKGNFKSFIHEDGEFTAEKTSRKNFNSYTRISWR